MSTSSCHACGKTIMGKQRVRIAYTKHDLTGHHIPEVYTHDQDTCAECSRFVVARLVPQNVVHAAWELIAEDRWTILQGVVR